MFLHSEGHPERFTELHGEEKREKGDRGGQEDKGGNQRRETDPANNQFPKCSLPSRTHTEIHKVLGREDKGEGGDRGDLVEKKENPKKERAVKPVISLPSKNRY